MAEGSSVDTGENAERVGLRASDFSNGQLPHPDILDLYHISVHRDHVHHLGSRQIDFLIKMNDSVAISGLDSILDLLEKMFENILTVILRDAKPDDKMRFVMQSPKLKKPISIPVLPVSELSLDLIMTAIAQVLNSNEEFQLDSTVQINFIHVKMPESAGGGNQCGSLTGRCELDVFKFLKRKKCIITAGTNDKRDNCCCERAILILRWLHEHPNIVNKHDKAFRLYKKVEI